MASPCFVQSNPRRKLSKCHLISNRSFNPRYNRDRQESAVWKAHAAGKRSRHTLPEVYNHISAHKVSSFEVNASARRGGFDCGPTLGKSQRYEGRDADANELDLPSERVHTQAPVTFENCGRWRQRRLHIWARPVKVVGVRGWERDGGRKKDKQHVCELTGNLFFFASFPPPLFHSCFFLRKYFV